MFALLTPPVLILTALRTKSLSPSRFLRTNAVSTFAAGGAFGALSAVGRVNGMGMDQAGQEDRAERIRANAGQRRTDDYCVIGGVLGAVSKDKDGAEGCETRAGADARSHTACNHHYLPPKSTTTFLCRWRGGSRCCWRSAGARRNERARGQVGRSRDDGRGAQECEGEDVI